MLLVVCVLLATVSPIVGIAEADIDVGPTTVEGAAFAVPDSMNDEVDQFRGSLVDPPVNAFILAKQDQLYVVFSESEPTKGKATVEGRVLERGITARNLSFGVIVASDTSFNTTGDPTAIQQVADNPTEYGTELVQIEATHRKASILNDPDRAGDASAPISSGILVDNPITASDIVSRMGEKARSLSINTSTEELGSDSTSEMESLLQTNQARLFTFDFEADFWSGGVSTVNGIVLTPGSEARSFVSAFDDAGVIRTDTDRALLYVVKTDRSTQEYSSVSTLEQESNDSEFVSITANLHGVQLSTQETLEENTPCGQERAQVPAPAGAICINIGRDVLVHGGVAWTTPPTSTDEMLFVAGLSSDHLDKPSEDIKGEYQITGEIVSTSRFDESLPEGRVLVVSSLERVGDVNLEDSSVEERVETRLGSINNSLRNQVNGTDSSPQPTQSPTTTIDPTSTSTSEPTQSPGQTSTAGPTSTDSVTEDPTTNPQQGTDTSTEQLRTETQTESEESGSGTDGGPGMPGMGFGVAVLAVLLTLLIARLRR